MNETQKSSIPKIDVSFGIIPLKKEGAAWSVFIIRHANGNHWGFPKGHPSSLVRAFSSASYDGQAPSSFSDSLSLRSQENYAGQVPSSPSEARLFEDKKASNFARSVRSARRASPDKTPDKPNNKEETPHETAERELREETGLTVTSYLPIEPFSTRYLCVSHGKYVDKTVTYFVAEVGDTVTLCPKEIAEGAWVTLEEAAQKMQFPEMKEIVIKLKAAL